MCAWAPSRLSAERNETHDSTSANSQLGGPLEEGSAEISEMRPAVSRESSVSRRRLAFPRGVANLPGVFALEAGPEDAFPAATSGVYLVSSLALTAAATRGRLAGVEGLDDWDDSLSFCLRLRAWVARLPRPGPRAF
jgi:hypothetical protein